MKASGEPSNIAIAQIAGSHSLAGAAHRGRHAAGTGERAAMMRDNSRREAPRTSSDLTSRSNETDGSPASILATRDWLEWSRLASWAWVRFRRRRQSRRPIASRTLSSTYAASPALSPRNSRAVPTFQPLASRRRRFSSRTVILPQSADACVDDWLRRRPSGLGEDRQNDNGVGIGAVHDPPIGFGVSNSQFVTARTHDWHRPRVRHRQARGPVCRQPDEDSRPRSLSHLTRTAAS